MAKKAGEKNIHKFKNILKIFDIYIKNSVYLEIFV